MRVYLVEDNPIIRESLAEAMQELTGAVVVGWADSENGARVDLARLCEKWDVAVIDLFLLQGSGLGVAKSLSARAQHQKVYIVTNYATPDMRERASAAGVDAIFDKSTELDALMDRLIGGTP